MESNRLKTAYVIVHSVGLAGAFAEVSVWGTFETASKRLAFHIYFFPNSLLHPRKHDHQPGLVFSRGLVFGLIFYISQFSA